MNPGPFLALTPGNLHGASAAERDHVLRGLSAAVEGGVRALLVREPALGDGAFLDFAQAAARILRAADGTTWLGVHDRVHLAGAIGADAVHLSGRSLPPADARRAVPDGTLVGVSTHSGDDPSTLTDHVAYALHAPVFQPNSKDAPPDSLLGVDAARAFARHAPFPVLALGGVDASTLEQFAGADDEPLAGVASIGGLWGRRSPKGVFDPVEIRERAEALTSRSRALFAGAGA